MSRPADLPNYDNPPLTEVIVGVQYEPFEKFNAIMLGEIYSLFKPNFPEVEEKPWLPPKMETFGGVSAPPAIQFGLLPDPMAPRLWFLSRSKDHLLQFQKDRLLLNWTKRDSGDAYPHFDGILDTFVTCLGQLGKYYSSKGHALRLSQAEVSYVNTIPVPSFSRLSEWLLVGSPPEDPITSLRFASEEVMFDAKRRPTRRFYIEVDSAHAQEGDDKAYRLVLTVRGKPHADEQIGLADYLLAYRRKIVETFDRINTTQAKKEWGRT